MIMTQNKKSDSILSDLEIFLIASGLLLFASSAPSITHLGGPQWPDPTARRVRPTVTDPVAVQTQFEADSDRKHLLRRRFCWWAFRRYVPHWRFQSASG